MPVEKYPFFPPMVKIDNMKIMDIHKKIMKTTYFEKIMKQKKGNVCLSCMSIFYKDRWKIKYGIIDIIKEVGLLLNTWQKNLEILQMERIISQKLKIDFDYLLEFII